MNHRRPSPSACAIANARLSARALVFVFLLAICTLALCLGEAGGQSPRDNRAIGSPIDEDEEGKLEREGVRLQDQIGEFKVRGDRAIFMTDDGKQFGGLENLNLERVVRAIADNPIQLTWSVTGVVTEYRGTNYLLITHAVVKNRDTPTVKPTKSAEKSDR